MVIFVTLIFHRKIVPRELFGFLKHCSALLKLMLAESTSLIRFKSVSMLVNVIISAGFCLFVCLFVIRSSLFVIRSCFFVCLLHQT